METGLDGLDEIKIEDFNKKDFILSKLSIPTPDRVLYLGQAIREGLSIDEIYEASKIDIWFIKRICEIINLEIKLKDLKLPLNKDFLQELKLAGFSDCKISKYCQSLKIRF